MESGGSIQRRDSVSVDALEQRSPGKTEEAKVSVRFSNSHRTATPVEPDTSLKLEQDQSSLESEPEARSLSSRSVRDVSSNKPGLLRRGAALVKKGAGKAASSAYNYGAKKLQSGKEKASSAWHSAKELGSSTKKAGSEFIHHPVDTTWAVANGVVQYGQEKLQAARGAASSLGGAVARGASALRHNPKETLKAAGTSTLRSLKNRSISVYHKAKKLIPNRVKNFSLPNIKSILSRSARAVPPQPSVSLKTVVAEAGKQSQRLEGLLGDNQDSRAQAEAAGENYQRLTQLLDDPSTLHQSAFEGPLTFPDGEQVFIGGDDVTRAQSIDVALEYALQQENEIREGQRDNQELVSQLKKEKKILKADIGKQSSTAKKEATSAEKAEYASEMKELQKERKKIGGLVDQIKQLLKSETQQFKEEIESQRKELKQQLQDSQKQLKDAVRELKAQSQNEPEAVTSRRANLAKTRKAVAKYKKEATRAQSEEDKATAAAGLDKARDVNNRLVKEISSLTVETQKAVAELEAKVAELEQEVYLKEQELEEFEVSEPTSSVIDELEERLEGVQDRLDENSRQIKARKKQHKQDRKEIGKLK